LGCFNGTYVLISGLKIEMNIYRALRKLAGFERLRDEGLESGFFYLTQRRRDAKTQRIFEKKASGQVASGQVASGQVAWMMGDWYLQLASCLLRLAALR
jgi:hypothetical protein